MMRRTLTRIALVGLCLHGCDQDLCASDTDCRAVEALSRLFVAHGYPPIEGDVAVRWHDGKCVQDPDTAPGEWCTYGHTDREGGAYVIDVARQWGRAAVMAHEGFHVSLWQQGDPDAQHLRTAEWAWAEREGVAALKTLTLTGSSGG